MSSALRSRLTTALVVALIVLAGGVLIHISTNVVTVLHMQAQTMRSTDVFDYVPSVVPVAFDYSFKQFGAVAIGVFATLALWPLRRDTSLGGAIGQAIVSSVVGALLVLVPRGLELAQSSPLTGMPENEIFIVGTLAKDVVVVFGQSVALVSAAVLGAWGRMRVPTQLAVAESRSSSDVG